MNLLCLIPDILSRTFFEFRLFFQGEWIKLVTYPILYEHIIPHRDLFVKNFFSSDQKIKAELLPEVSINASMRFYVNL